VALGHPYAADVDGTRRLDVTGAEHELGRPAADVHDEVGPHRAERREVLGRAGEGEPGLLVARDDLRLDSEDVDDATDELVPVGGVAGGAGGHDAYALGAMAGHELRVGAHRGEGALESLRREAPGLVHALAEPYDLHPAFELDQLPAADVGDEQADRVRAAVDRGHACRCAQDLLASRLVPPSRPVGTPGPGLVPRTSPVFPGASVAPALMTTS
jgi:hypothetical protein